MWKEGNGAKVNENNLSVRIEKINTENKCFNTFESNESNG
jgi:hypothetical protein